MSKYERLKSDLDTKGYGEMKCYGNSMLPLLDNPTTNTYIVQKKYKVGDIVFCRVKGRWIDSHLITQVNEQRGYMISNNHGWQNGWTKQIYGRVIKSVNNNNKVKWFNFSQEFLDDYIKSKNK